MPRHKSEIMDFECDVVHETDKAWLVEIDGDEHWIPKSVSQFDADTGKITVETWWAKKNELA